MALVDQHAAMPSTPAQDAATLFAARNELPAADRLGFLADLPTDHPWLQAADRLADAADSDDPDERRAGIAALFGGLVEPLNDAFDRRGRDWYSRVFARIIARCAERRPELSQALAAWQLADEEALFSRHCRVRVEQQPVPDEVHRVAVLSRVTIGADVLLASVVLQHSRRRWPEAELFLIGEQKLQPLLGGLAEVQVLPLSYARRGGLGERLLTWTGLERCCREARIDLVLAPDSRLDQLGLLPVIAVERYRLWENLQPAGPPRGLADLADDWCRSVLGTTGDPIVPRLGLDKVSRQRQRRLARALGPEPTIAVKLDHGGNPAKALPRTQEIELLHRLRESGWRILIDRGFGTAEIAASDELMAALGWQPVDCSDQDPACGRLIDELVEESLADAAIIRLHGSIATWAAAVGACRAAFSYDSVGHHLAAAVGTPLISACTGWNDPVFPIAWRPCGRAPVHDYAIPAERRTDPELVTELVQLIDQYGPRH